MFLRVTRNDVSPALARLARTGRDPRKVLLAMGATFKSITEGNFYAAGADMRPVPWRNKRDGSPSNLRMTNTLSRSFHLEVTSAYAKLSNSAKYAAIHQFGGVIRPKAGKLLRWVGADGKAVFARQVTIPARPFFPVMDGHLTPAAENLIRRAGLRALAREGGAK